MRAEGRIEAIPEAGYFINIGPALAACFIERTLKLGDKCREGVIALLKSI
jgi:hypothetical protein